MLKKKQCVKKSRFKKKILRSFIIFFILYAILNLIACSAEKIMFVPPTPQITPFTEELKTNRNEKLSYFYRPHPEAEYTILYSHGNAEDLSTVANELIHLFYNQKYSILAYDYSGYGNSSGTPSEENCYKNITRIYNFATKNLKIPSSKIIITGFSIGTGPSCYLAETNPAAALVLFAPFSSITRVATKIKIIPFDYFNNLNRMKKINCPLLIFHGEKDRIIPSWHSELLFNAKKNAKERIVLPFAGHNSLKFYNREHIANSLQKFLKKYSKNSLNK